MYGPLFFRAQWHFFSKVNITTLSLILGKASRGKCISHARRNHGFRRLVRCERPTIRFFRKVLSARSMIAVPLLDRRRAAPMLSTTMTFATYPWHRKCQSRLWPNCSLHAGKDASGFRLLCPKSAHWHTAGPNRTVAHARSGRNRRSSPSRRPTEIHPPTRDELDVHCPGWSPIPSRTSPPECAQSRLNEDGSRGRLLLRPTQVFNHDPCS